MGLHLFPADDKVLRAILPSRQERGTMHRFYVGLRIALLALFCAYATFAQRDLATLVGTVTDPSGGVVPNAKVAIVENGPGQVSALLTSAGGAFVRPALKPSPYSVTVSPTGFRTKSPPAL